MRALAALVLALALLHAVAAGRVVNIESMGAVPEQNSLAVCNANKQVLATALASLTPGDTLLVPAGKTFWLMGGIVSQGLHDVTVRIDGTLKFSDDEKAWPRDEKKRVLECLLFESMNNVTFTSGVVNGVKGTIDGNGNKWWGIIKYLEIGENRPRLFHVKDSTNLLVENLLFRDSPYWTTYFNNVENLEIRFSDVEARRDNHTWHDINDMTAFNTDGFDVAGRNIWIHDCNVWNEDDCVCVKTVPGPACSENMLFERINASGVGLTVGSITPSAANTCIRNITFRDSVMPNTFKGLYLKSNPGKPGETGIVKDVLYENIRIEQPSQWAIWLGPQQAIYGDDCSLFWPELPTVKCPVGPGISWENIMFRNIDIFMGGIHSLMSPGVILGNETNPMKNVTFDGVRVHSPGSYPWGDKYYACANTVGYATNTTWPIPPCFKVV